MWPLQKASVRVGTRRKRRLPGWLGVGWDNFFVVVNRKKSSSQNKKSLFKPKNLCGLCKKHQFVLVPGVKVGCDDG
jgi:hypothetical protein